MRAQCVDEDLYANEVVIASRKASCWIIVTNYARIKESLSERTRKREKTKTDRKLPDSNGGRAKGKSIWQDGVPNSRHAFVKLGPFCVYGKPKAWTGYSMGLGCDRKSHDILRRATLCISRSILLMEGEVTRIIINPGRSLEFCQLNSTLALVFLSCVQLRRYTTIDLTLNTSIKPHPKPSKVGWEAGRSLPSKDGKRPQDLEQTSFTDQKSVESSEACLSRNLHTLTGNGPGVP